MKERTKIASLLPSLKSNTDVWSPKVYQQEESCYSSSNWVAMDSCNFMEIHSSLINSVICVLFELIFIQRYASNKGFRERIQYYIARLPFSYQPF
ncbi:hypothetical protein FGO68_gene843 [Halteria grandinella]|uniref:Uncharacterized protein n=1 Tax=Halteria grandinella TaxID=5974 RepID=A0A8J8NDY4_HALGN|nr:hypothetical protein FGO68_gene843 [Halteria grandinella]